jgi:hypothetical protein
MQTIGLDKNVETTPEPDAAAADNRPKGFWRLQFAGEATPAQRKFDWAFGVILPVICVAFDPFVFKGNIAGNGAAFGAYKPFAYLLSFVSIMAFLAWLIWGKRLKGLNVALSGLFFYGALISLAVGVVLFPVSTFGLVFLIGALGYTPLFSGFVYLRNSYRAFGCAEHLFDKGTLVRSFVLAALFSAVIPWTVNREIGRSMDRMLSGDAEAIYAEAAKLKYVAPLVNLDKLKRQICSAPDSKRNRAAIKAYRELNGKTRADGKGVTCGNFFDGDEKF